MMGGYNENPNVKSFMYGANSIRVQGSAALKPFRGNSRRLAKSTFKIDETPLLKRKRTNRSAVA